LTSLLRVGKRLGLKSRITNLGKLHRHGKEGGSERGAKCGPKCGGDWERELAIAEMVVAIARDAWDNPLNISNRSFQILFLIIH
jgi:hypothetical protein